MRSEVSGKAILGVICMLMGLSALSVAGRFYTRFWLRRDGALDDWLILTSLLWALGMTICEGVQVHYGLGTNGGILGTTKDPHILQPFWGAIWTYHLSMGFCRVSVVLQCLRIFPQASRGWVKWMMWFLAMANCVNMIWAFMSTLFTCIPTRKFWHPEVSGHCFNRTALYMTNSTLAMVLDAAVAMLPIPWIRSLRLPLQQKVLLGGIFILAGLPCVLAAIRVQSLIETTSSQGTDYTDGILAIFSCAEVYAAIICACLPSLKACWSHLRARCIRSSHMICKWLPCSSCLTHHSNEGGVQNEEALDPHVGQEQQGEAPRQVGVTDWAKSTVQTITEEEGPVEVEWRETTIAVRRLGVLSSVASCSDTGVSSTALRLGVLPTVSGTTFVNTAGPTEPG